MFIDPTPKRRWPRAQRFVLSPKGLDAEALYRSTIVASRASGGRASYDSAREEWASAMGVQPDDGAYLVEVSAGPCGIEDLAKALESSGKKRADAFGALGRLFDAGLIVTRAPLASSR